MLETLEREHAQSRPAAPLSYLARCSPERDCFFCRQQVQRLEGAVELTLQPLVCRASGDPMRFCIPYGGAARNLRAGAPNEVTPVQPIDAEGVPHTGENRPMPGHPPDQEVSCCKGGPEPSAYRHGRSMASALDDAPSGNAWYQRRRRRSSARRRCSSLRIGMGCMRGANSALSWAVIFSNQFFIRVSSNCARLW